MSTCPRCAELEQEMERLRSMIRTRKTARNGSPAARYRAAVDRRLTEFDRLSKTQEPTIRMWITQHVVRALGIRRIGELTEDNVEQAITVVHTTRRSWGGSHLCACDLCRPELEQIVDDLRRRVEHYESMTSHSAANASSYRARLEQAEALLKERKTLATA